MSSNMLRISLSLIILLVLVSLACAGGGAYNLEPASQGEAASADDAGGSAEKVYVEESASEAEAPPAEPALAAPNDADFDSMFFESAGVNPFIDTEDDHLSTFATDVDTGSYTIARNYVNRGSLPPKEAIRVEEFVNYFDQAYPYPSQEDVFNIHIDGAPFPFSQTERYQMLRVGLQGYAIAPEDRKDVALTFVVDVSGSMSRENRLELVKDSLALLTQELRPTDSVAIVVYGSDTYTVLEPTSGEDKAAILRAIDTLEINGSTNAEAGLRLGYQEALKAFRPDAINRVILCSDGVANVGNTSADSIWEQIKGYASEGITLTSVGVGLGNYNDVLMEQLADQGNGFYAYVDTLREAERLFVHDLSGTLQAIAMDAKVQVDFNPEVVARYRLVGFENRAIADEDFRNDAVDAGEIGAGHNVTALYEVKLHPEAAGQIAEVFLRWEDPDSREVREISQSFHSEALSQRFSEANLHFQRAVLVAEYAEILRQSIWAEENNLAALLEEVDRLNGVFDGNVQMQEFSDLLHLAQNLQ